MNYWIEDNLGWIIGTLVGGVIALIIVLAFQSNRETDLRYQAMLRMAHTSHDSITIMLAFEKMKSDATNAAVVQGAIITAGSLAGSRR